MEILQVVREIETELQREKLLIKLVYLIVPIKRLERVFLSHLSLAFLGSHFAFRGPRG